MGQHDFKFKILSSPTVIYMIDFIDNLSDLARTQMRIFKTILTATLASALILAAFPAGAVSPSWSTPVDLSATGEDAYDAQITVSSTGLATAIWSRYDGEYDIIQSSTSQSGGAWTTPVNLSAAGQDASDPQLTVDSTGLVTAVWLRDDGMSRVQSSTSLSGGAWTTPFNLSAAGANAFTAQVTVDSTGLATAIWSRFNGSNFVIQSSTSQSGGTWSDPVNLSASGQDASDPELTVDSTGLVTAVWMRFNGSNFVIQSRTSQSGGAWSTPTADLSATGGNADRPKVTVSSTGLATAIWSRYGGSNDFIQASTLSNSTPTTLAATGTDVELLLLGSLTSIVAGAGFFALSRRKRTA
jgi:hypothetical protein